MTIVDDGIDEFDNNRIDCRRGGGSRAIVTAGIVGVVVVIAWGLRDSGKFNMKIIDKCCGDLAEGSRSASDLGIIDSSQHLFLQRLPDQFEMRG